MTLQIYDPLEKENIQTENLGITDPLYSTTSALILAHPSKPSRIPLDFDFLLGVISQQEWPFQAIIWPIWCLLGPEIPSHCFEFSDPKNVLFSGLQNYCFFPG